MLSLLRHLPRSHPCNWPKLRTTSSRAASSRKAWHNASTQPTQPTQTSLGTEPQQIPLDMDSSEAPDAPDHLHSLTKEVLRELHCSSYTLQAALHDIILTIDSFKFFYLYWLSKESCDLFWAGMHQKIFELVSIIVPCLTWPCPFLYSIV